MPLVKEIHPKKIEIQPSGDPVLEVTFEQILDEEVFPFFQVPGITH